MPLLLRTKPVERAQPLLGTLVAIRVHDVADDAAHAAISAAFAEIAAVHCAMSFHAADSDISRLNLGAFDGPIAVRPETFAVLQTAQRMAAATDGLFDITVAAQLVNWGLLPRPTAAWSPDPLASWRDIELSADGGIRFHRRLWIDLGGIAKGYAVDRAIECLLRHSVRNCCVNAGGDLRAIGIAAERVWLRSALRPSAMVAALDVADGSVASSSSVDCATVSAHVDGGDRSPVGRGKFASVVAESCMIADALTKPVLALGRQASEILRRFGATAYLCDSQGGWLRFGAAP